MISRRSLLKASAVATGVLAMPHVARAKPVRVVLSHAVAEVHPAQRAAEEFKKAVEELVPGALDVQIFANRALGDDKQGLESTMAGVIQMCIASGVLFPLVTGIPSMDAYQLPFLVEDYDHFLKLSTGEIGQKIQAELETSGVVGLATIDIGQRHFLSRRKPVSTMSGFAGLKTRIVPVPLHKAIWEAVGTAPVGLPTGEVYAALETGVVDAVEINVSSMLSENYWEVAKEFTLTGHYPWHSVTTINKAFLESLPDEVQQAVREAGRRSVQPTLAYTKEQDRDGRAVLKSRGVVFHELEDVTEMRKRVAPILDQWSAKSPLIAEFVATARGML